MNQIRIYSILIMLIIMPFSGCISSNEIVEESSIPTHVIVQEDTPSKISFNKQDELMALELRAVNPAWTPLPVSWESLLLIVSNGEEEYGCVPPLLSSRVELVGDGPATVRINEIVVSNDNGAQDEKGDYVKVIAGPFIDFSGTVEEVNDDKQKVKIVISIFGRLTPVELDYFQVELEK